MMKRHYLALLVALLLVPVISSANNQWTIRGVGHDVDTIIFPHQVGPGMIAAKYSVPDFPFLVSVVEMDLTNPYTLMESCLGTGHAVGTETPISMAERSTGPNHEVVGAINGDFFLTMSSKEMGIPTSGHVSNGELQVSSHNRGCIVIDENKRPYIDRLTFSGTVKSGETSFPLQLVNRMRYSSENIADNQTILFTPAFGTATYGGSVSGKMVLLKPAGEAFKWSANGTEHCIIESIMTAHHATPIPEGKAILLLKGSHAAYANSLHEGDELTITCDLKLNNGPQDITVMQLVGGSNHIFLRNGAYTGEAWDERHPRTAVGFNADSTRLYFVVVDGRHTSSAGATLEEMVGIFLGLGAVNAVNLDGGGSSCMMVNGDVINHPSDGPIRGVGNGCLFVSTAPEDDAIGIIRFEPRRYNLPISASTSFKVWGYNQYGALKTRDLDGCVFSCDPEVGTFDENGHFNASTTPANGNLYVTCNGVTATQPISIIDAKWELVNDSVVIDLYHPYTIGINGVSSYGYDSVDPSAVPWVSVDESVCTVDEMGVVTALADGMTFVGSAHPLVSDSLLVRVENPKSRVAAVEDVPFDPETWTVSQSGGKNRVVTALDNGLQIDFTGASSRNPYIKIAKSLQLWGIPDLLRVRILPGNVPVKSLKMLIETAHAERVTVEYPIPETEGEAIINVPVSEICESSDLGNFPLHLIYYYITYGSVTTGEQYSLKVPGMELVYARVPIDEPIEGDVNGDGEINIADVNAIIGIILNGTQADAGDVNNDGEVNIADINTVIDMILGNS